LFAQHCWVDAPHGWHVPPRPWNAPLHANATSQVPPLQQASPLPPHATLPLDDEETPGPVVLGPLVALSWLACELDEWLPWSVLAEPSGRPPVLACEPSTPPSTIR
jgi:hypothetical protein